jgi:membrane protein YqaA with SNARE-associated domain
MQGFLELAGLFWAAFLSATVLPASSEAAFLALAALGRHDMITLVAVATVGNTLGSLPNWLLGRYVETWRDHPRFPVRPAEFARYEGWYRRFGRWSLLAAWVPVIGDPLTVMAGVMRMPVWQFALLTGAGKLARYMALGGFFALVT